MPFITQERREQLENFEANMFPLGPGDRCYLYYKEMVREWKGDPCWTTAHEIYKRILNIPEHGSVECGDPDNYVAMHLAWQVFFLWYVVPYEEEKEEINGSI